MTTLNEVYSVTHTQHPEVFMVHCNITDMNGETYDCDYVTRPEDTFGLNPTIQQWLTDHPDYPRGPYVPPTQEEIRAGMFPLSARQFRLGMLKGGILSTDVVAVIEAMPEGVEKETAKIEWEYATTFSRLHPLVVQLSHSLGFTPETIDQLWEDALNV